MFEKSFIFIDSWAWKRKNGSRRVRSTEHAFTYLVRAYGLYRLRFVPTTLLHAGVLLVYLVAYVCRYIIFT